MKNYLLILLLLLWGTKLFAQVCIDAMPPGIPLPPANSKSYWNWKGDDAAKFNGTGNYFYRKAIQGVPPNGIVPTTHYGPFSNTLNQANTFQFTNSPIDFEEADGWELAYRYFGEIVPCQASSVDNPYFVLYNRFTGTLRIFVTLTSNPASNGAAISLMGISTYKNSAALAYGDEIVAPLQFFNTNPGELKYVNEAVSCGVNNTCQTWYYADFKIFYDPCICSNQVNWKIKFDLITTEWMKWEVNGTEEQILGPGTASNKKATLLTVGQGVAGAIGGTIKAGKRGYKEGESFEQDAQGFLNDNKEFLVEDQELLSNSTFNKITSLLSLAPGVGAAFGAVNFLSTAFGFLKPDKGTVVTPYKSKITHHADGYKTSTIHPVDQELKLPGSLIQEKPKCINEIQNGPLEEDLGIIKPRYDRPLGVVSLINPVVMEYAEYNCDPVIRKITTWPFGGYDDERVTPNPVREYRLVNPLKFAVNPASDLEIESIDAAFFFDFPNMPADNCTNSGHRFALSDYGPFVLGMEKPFGPYYLVEDPNYSNYEMNNCGNAGRELLHSKTRYARAGYEIFTADNRVICAPSFMSPPDYERVNLKNIAFKSPTVPIGLLKAMTFKLFYDGSFPFQKIRFNIFLKHRVTGKKFLEIVSYQVYEQHAYRSPLDPGNLKYTSDRYKSACESVNGTFPQEVTVYQHYPTSINTSPFQNCLAGLPSDIEYKHQEVISQNVSAIYKITIGAGTTFQANASNPIEIKGLEIEVDHSVEIPPYVTLLVGHENCMSSESNIANVGDIKAVCGSGDYIARANFREAVASNGKVLSFSSRNESILGYPVPNPTTGDCSLSFDMAEPGGYRMVITNLLGEEVKLLEKRDFAAAGKHEVRFQTADMEAGVYFITLSAEGFRQARKLVVVK